MLVPRNHLLVVTAHQRTIIEPIHVSSEDGLYDEIDEGKDQSLFFPLASSAQH